MVALALVSPLEHLPSQAKPASVGTLSIREVVKSYRLHDRELPVLAGIDLEVAPGSFTAILGASGCGKSTLLRLILGLDADYGGEILLDGKQIRGTGLERGIVFQEHRLFPWLTVAQNVALALAGSTLTDSDKRETVREHLRLVGLTAFEGAYPHQLSGGMSQRAAIARALVNKPKLLLLDEPFGALDALTRLHLQTELQRLWQNEGVTMILVTHDIEEAVFLGQQVVVMDARPGRIKRRLAVRLPYPRDRADPELLHIKQQLLAEFRIGSLAADSGATRASKVHES
jgi:ABC-type nitrate/sulfonate/bicarbonate transport system ATPase subunit